MTVDPGGASVEDFYQDLAAHYHLLFADWYAAVRRQGRILDRLIARLAGPGPKRVLDAACGIGTQAIGLALQGHRVVASDLSPAAVDRAAAEARRLGAVLSLRTADMRALSMVGGRYEIVTALDNALAHFLCQPDLEAACAGLASALEPGGLLLASIRHYDELIGSRPEATPVRLFDGEAGRRMTFQIWDWAEDGASYALTQYIVRHEADRLAALAFQTRSRALLRADLTAALEAAGLLDVRWFESDASGFYQPVVAAWQRP